MQGLNLLASPVFEIFGPTKFVVSDNVSRFKSHCFKELSLEYGVQNLLSARTTLTPPPDSLRGSTKIMKLS